MSTDDYFIFGGNGGTADVLEFVKYSILENIPYVFAAMLLILLL